MRALDRKLLRDLVRLWKPALAIALVLGCGIMTMVMMRGTAQTLERTRAEYYADQRFAEVFAHAERIPPATVAAIAALPDVAQVEARLVTAGRFALPGVRGTVQVVSLPENGAALRLNRPVLRSGRLPDPLREDEVAVSEPFALANGLRPSDALELTLKGRVGQYRVTGTLMSPEFVYAVPQGAMMPDDRHHGIVWMDGGRLQALLGLKGAANDLVATLRPGAGEARVLDAIDRQLDRFGGAGAYGRGRQMSHAFLSNELDQLATLANWLPPVFLIVSAFLVNMVLDRLVRLERSQIGLLKAVGYGTGQILRHYLGLALGIGAAGIVLGWVTGWLMGAWMTVMYRDFFRFPHLAYQPDLSAFLWSGLAAVVAVALGAVRAVAGAAALAPAVAMQAPPPPAFGRGLADRLGAVLRLGRLAMMVLRAMLRRPWRALSTGAGVAAAVAILVASFFTFDVIEVVMDDIFNRTNRQDVTLALTAPAEAGAVRLAAAELPGVTRAEAESVLPVRLRHGAVARLTTLRLHDQGAGGDGLVRVLDEAGRPVLPAPGGITLPGSLARALGARPGDLIEVELLVAPRGTYSFRFAGTVRQAMGQEAHMPAALMTAALRRPAPVTSVNLRVDPAGRAAFDRVVAASPQVAAVTDWRKLRDQFNETMNASLLTSTLIFSAIGMLITLGVVYNAARIQLAERSHELATLRVLGFYRVEVGAVLVGEQMLTVILSLPFGLAAGHGLAALMVRGFSSEIVSMPFVIHPGTYALATGLTLATALVTAIAVARGHAKVDLVSALKNRDQS